MTFHRNVFASCSAVFVAVCALVLLPASAASAHPLGNFTVNRYDGLVAASGTLRVLHIEDLAEIPATQAEPAIKEQGMEKWAEARCATAARDSEVTVGGKDVALTVGSSHAEERPGQAGLTTLRVECGLTAPLPDRVTSVRFQAAVDSGPGWREVTARGDRMTLTESDVPETSVSRRLTSYPKELLSSPEDTASASLEVRPGGPALATGEDDAPGASILPRGADRWTKALDDLVARQDLSIGFAALALGIAVFLGAMHAMAPGHGKTIMAATAAARGNATFRDVLPMIVSVTITHTLGVVALGLLIAAGSSAAPSVITWLGIASGLLVMAAGVSLVRRAVLNRKLMRQHAHDQHDQHDDDHTHHHDEQDHDEQDHHEHADAPAHEPERALVLAHAHADGTSHTHEHAPPKARALAHSHAPEHAHATAHRHDHGHTHDHEHEHDHTHNRGHDHSHDRKRTLFGGTITHTHGGFTHSHPVAPTVRGTILLGFAGGLVPSPSAVVVLVGAAALGKAWFGLVLVLAFGVGLALTLTGVGFAVVRAGDGMTRLLDRRPRLAGGPAVALLRRTVPLASALVVVALGAGLVLKGAASALG
ncbi:nickel transporter [Streptomyces sp. KM273126]|uniref:nickel transporter n=1 Tax=Streptomyces sp. KM273126 TaxID=2545247 RepID=UPI00103E9D38|nr:nickel transporter [Streptomyces sp. KM273126]MBA2812329.1 nickel transporter [Streptomyces sp. KM273126]